MSAEVAGWPHIVRPHLIIFDRSQQLVNITEDQRKANVTPILEKGKKEEAGNYTSLSLISIPGNVREQLILETIFRHGGQEGDQE